MIKMVDWAGEHARTIVAFIILSIAVGAVSYVSLPKEGEPDIEIPALFVSVVAPGISAEDSERLIVKPMESRFSGLTGLDDISGVASEGYGGVALNFDFDWDRDSTLADVREEMNDLESIFPDAVASYSINEVNFSEFPIVIVSVSGEADERLLLRAAKDLQDEILALTPVLSADLSGVRDEMLEVIIDPLKLETYNLSAAEVLGAVQNNNRLIAAGTIVSGAGEYAIKIPSAFDSPQDVYELPIKVSGKSMITIGDVAEIRPTFEDAEGYSRFNGEQTFAVQVVKRKGENLIDTVELVKETVASTVEDWPALERQIISVDITFDRSKEVKGMVQQLESSVLTAVMLVMVTVFASLGFRNALLVGFAIPTSFLLCFALLAIFDITISNITMFGLILAVGMLVDGAIVVVEYADSEISKGVGPMRAYMDSAQRMFWPIVSSTATTLCAFLPLLFWPGIAGQFMGSLPRTIIFVLCSSLVVALIYLPVVGGIAGRMSRTVQLRAQAWRERLPKAVLFLFWVFAALALFLSLQIAFRRSFLFGILLFLVMSYLLAVASSALFPEKKKTIATAYRRTWFGKVISFFTRAWWRPFLAIGGTVIILITIFNIYRANGNGVEFFVEIEPEQAIAYVQARGNLSLDEKDRLVRQVEAKLREVDGIENLFAFSGSGGLNSNTGGGEAPNDTIGTVQLELLPWEERLDWPDGTGKGKYILAEANRVMAEIPGIQAQTLELAQGPAAAKPINIRLKGDIWADLDDATNALQTYMRTLPGVTNIEDTRPLPGIDWQLDIDVSEAGRYGTNVAAIGSMVQLVTRGVTIGQMRVDTSDDEIDIRLRYPKENRTLETLDNLRVQSPSGLIPISNFVEREAVKKIGQIDRIDQTRYYRVMSDIEEGFNANDRLALIIEWLEDDNLPPTVSWEIAGDFADQAESTAFLGQAFLASLGLMFVILLAQFNSLYDSMLVLFAVVLSTIGVLLGMVVMDQTFSVIMTGTGILALAGIVVNNNIILIDTYQDFRRYMPEIEAIIRTAEARLRPVLLTTITTVAGLTPMMLGISLDFAEGGYTVDSPTALWWKNLATAIVFGLGFATFITLMLTPSLLALKVWFGRATNALSLKVLRLFGGKSHPKVEDGKIQKTAKRIPVPEINWLEVEDIKNDQ